MFELMSPLALADGARQCRGRCAELSFELTQSAYVSAFRSNRRQVQTSSCIGPVKRKARSSLRYKVNVPHGPRSTSAKDGIGFYVIASRDVTVAHKISRHIQRASSKCGGLAGVDHDHWLNGLLALIEKYRDDLEWQAMHFQVVDGDLQPI